MTPRFRVLLSAPYAMSIVDRYRACLEAAGCEVVVANVRERLTERELLPLVGDVDGIICGDDQITERVLAGAPRLKVISKWGTGIDSIDQAAAAARHIAVRNTPNAFSEPVADSTLGYMLIFARQLPAMTDAIRRGEWSKPQLVALGERTLGVIGVGNCGKAVVRRAVAFGMRVVGHDLVQVDPAFVAETGIRMVPRDELLRESDFVTLHTSLNPTSRHLMNADTLSRMKPGAYLINTSRGPVVEEAALVGALTSGRLAGVAMDVFEDEPLPADSRLRHLANCWFAPHNANSSPRAAHRVHVNTVRNLFETLGMQHDVESFFAPEATGD